MDAELKAALIRLYGKQILKHEALLDERIVKTVAVTLWGATEGDSIVCNLNQAFDLLPSYR